MAKDKDQALFEIHENRLSRMDTRIGHIEAQSNDMHAIITNGLVERVKLSIKLSLLNITLFAGVIATQIYIINMILSLSMP